MADGDVIESKLLGITETGRMQWDLVEDSLVKPQFSRWEPRVYDNQGRFTNPAWMPLPGSQKLFLECPVYEALYEGTRGPGKTLTLLMDFAKDVGKGWGQAWRGILFRKTFGDLDDVVRKIDDFFPRIFGDDFIFLRSKSDYMARFPTGETLLLRHMLNEDDYHEYHGHEYPWIGWEELTQWETDKAYRLMMSCSRPTRPGITTRVRATTNPYGPGHNWVKERFRLPGSRGRIIRTVDDEGNAQDPRVAIHGSLKENFLVIHQDPGYPARIRAAATSPAQAEAWLNGDWNVTAGGMIDDLWRPDIHIVPHFPAGAVPRGWRLTRAYDHGQSSPFSVGWFYESDGTPMEWEGRILGRIRGDLIHWHEWYGRKSEAERNTGLRMSSSRIARGILDREEDWDVSGRVLSGPADTEIFNKSSERFGRSPADDFEELGVVWERADKSRGTRPRGWMRLRDMLENAIPNPDGTREKPGFFVSDSCRWWLKLCPPMPRADNDPDDVPKEYEDHAADMTRYRINYETPGMFRRSF